MHVDLQPVWQAFVDLSADRQPAMQGVSPIPTREILAYLREIQGVQDRDDLQFRYRMVRTLDAEFRQWHAETQDTNPSGGSQGRK